MQEGNSGRVKVEHQERKDQDNEKKEKDSKWKELRDKDRDNTPGERYKRVED